MTYEECEVRLKNTRYRWLITGVAGFLNVLDTARNLQVKILTYAASSVVYGDNPDLPKIENKMGSLLSPYALTKKVNELYAEVYCRNFSMSSLV